MKALIRQENEVILETTALRFIDWSTGAPLTNESWSGGPYILVENYDPAICRVVNPDEFAKISDTEVEFTIQERGTGVDHVNTPTPETVTIDGKTYTKDELLALLNQTS